MPGHPQPEAEGAQRSGRRSRWGAGPRPRPGEAQQADVYRDGAATLRPCDAVDGKQKQQCGGAQTSGGVSQLPLAVAARHGEESDGHALQVTSLVCECVNVCRTLLKTSVAALQGSHPRANLLPWQPPDSITAQRDRCCFCLLWVRDLLLWLFRWCVGCGACSFFDHCLFDVFV